MDTPVYGFVIHEDGDSNGVHRHEMYLMTWDGRVLHVHEFSGFTSHDVGHHHRYAGTTNPAPNTPNHAHDYETITSFDDGHRHLIRGRTAPPYHFRQAAIFISSKELLPSTEPFRTITDIREEQAEQLVE